METDADDEEKLTTEPCVCGHRMDQHEERWDMWGIEPAIYPGACLSCRACSSYRYDEEAAWTRLS